MMTVNGPSQTGLDWHMYLVRILAIIVFFLTTPSFTAMAQPYVAFSLRQAECLAQQSRKMSNELFSIGGITRIVGMVHDSEGEDIILVGRAVENLPEGSLDDLVVALRTRLLYDEWPMVSIDPTEGTSKTGLQKVNFGGGIAGTPFGRDILDCDIILKEYSLQLLPQTKEVPSYKSLYLHNLVESIKAEGVRVTRTEWILPDLSKNFYGQPIRDVKSYQVRFWFYPLEPGRVVTEDGVFCIKELRLCVKAELQSGNRSGITTMDTRIDLTNAEEMFCQQFTEHFYKMTSAQPKLKKLKILSDLTAVAEAIRNIMDRPNFTYFLKEYCVSHVNTDGSIPLSQAVAIIERSDGLVQAIQISGGIEFKTELKWLNKGTVTHLRDIVLKTRPSPDALLWTLPLEDWKIPMNSEGLELKGDSDKASSSYSVKMHSEKKGCSVFTQSFVLETASEDSSSYRKKFFGFPPPPPPPPFTVASPQIKYLDIGGVEIDPQLEKAGKGGAETRDKVLNSRTEDTPFWTAEIPEEEILKEGNN